MSSDKQTITIQIGSELFNFAKPDPPDPQLAAAAASDQTERQLTISITIKLH